MTWIECVFLNYGQVAKGSTRQCIKSSRDACKLVFNPVQLLLLEVKQSHIEK